MWFRLDRKRLDVTVPASKSIRLRKPILDPICANGSPPPRRPESEGISLLGEAPWEPLPGGGIARSDQTLEIAHGTQAYSHALDRACPFSERRVRDGADHDYNSRCQ